MIYLLPEPEYSNNRQAQEIIKGLNRYAGKRKHSLIYCSDVEEVDHACKTIIVLCASDIWGKQTLQRLCARGIHPIIYGSQNINTPIVTSCVIADYVSAAYLLTKNICQASKGKRYAFVGFNADSVPDRLKLEGFTAAISEMNAECKVFQNYGSIDDCLLSVVQCDEQLDGLICANDYIAMLLVSRYEEYKNIAVGGFGSTIMPSFVPKKIYTTEVLYEEIGKTLMDLYFFLEKQTVPKSVTVKMPCQIIKYGNEIVDSNIYSISSFSSNFDKDKLVDFYGDTSIKEVVAIDKMLMLIDDTDKKILSLLCAEKSYEEIAEKTYLSPNALRYRVKKIINTVNVDTKSELIDLILKYKLIFR